MSLRKLVSALALFLCLLLAACGTPFSPVITESPTPSPNPNTKVTEVQSPEFVPEQSSIFTTPGAGLQLPEIQVTGPCNFVSSEAMNQGTSSTPAVSIPAGEVFVADFANSSEMITQNNLNPANGTPVETFVSVYTFLTVSGPTIYGDHGGLEGMTYTIVPTTQVGETIAAMVMLGLTQGCAAASNPSPLYDSSLVSLGEQYPYPARFQVCARGC